MHTKQKIYSVLCKLFSIFAAIEIDLLLTEKQIISSPPCTLTLFILFLNKQQHGALFILCLLSLPFSLLRDHASGVHLLFYIFLFLLHAIFQNSIHIKKTIPYFLATSFLLIEKIYFYFWATGDFSIKDFMIKVIATNSLLFICLQLQLLSKKK